MALVDLERFYSLLERLEARSPRVLLKDFRLRELPSQGVYFFREPGELRAPHSQERIVRVGTHAITSASRATLRSRLRAHRGNTQGAGNHRGSVFRRHVGAALIVRDQLNYPTWGRGSSTTAANRKLEEPLERAVSNYLWLTSVVWLAVPDALNGRGARAVIEKNSIALLASQGRADRPSPTWLGNHSPAEPIRRSGLWNVNHVDETCDPSFLDLLEAFIDRP